MSRHDQWRRMTAPAKDYRRAIIFLSVTLLPTTAVMLARPDLRYHEPPKVEAPAPAYVAPVQTTPRHRCHGIGGPCEIISDSHYGCSDTAVDEKLSSFLVQGDKDAFRNLLSRALEADVCRFWKKGESVFKQTGGFTQFCLRSPGEMRCYWTAREAVED